MIKAAEDSICHKSDIHKHAIPNYPWDYSTY